MVKKNITTKAVAQLLSVSEATVKRWTDDGLLRALKTAGGHRRFHVEEVARFQREQRTGAMSEPRRAKVAPAPHTAARGKKLSVSHAAVFAALVGGQEEEVAALLVNAHLYGATPAAIFDELVCKAMRRVGDLWCRGELTVAQEHLATHTALSALHALRGVISAREARGLSAICCCVEDDFHELPVHLAQVLLEGEGWSVVNLGANTPFFALGEALAEHEPDMVCVSSTVLLNRDRAAHDYAGFRAASERKGVRVVLGGKGFTEDERIRRRFPADLYAESFAELATLVSSFA